MCGGLVVVWSVVAGCCGPWFAAYPMPTARRRSKRGFKAVGGIKLNLQLSTSSPPYWLEGQVPGFLLLFPQNFNADQSETCCIARSEPGARSSPSQGVYKLWPPPLGCGPGRQTFCATPGHLHSLGTLQDQGCKTTCEQSLRSRWHRNRSPCSQTGRES